MKMKKTNRMNAKFISFEPFTIVHAMRNKHFYQQKLNGKTWAKLFEKIKFVVNEVRNYQR